MIPTDLKKVLEAINRAEAEKLKRREHNMNIFILIAFILACAIVIFCQ